MSGGGISMLRLLLSYRVNVWYMRYKIIVFGLLYFVFSFVFAQTHCETGEDVVFSCKITKSSKVVSLCAKSNITNNQKKLILLQYRFGKLNVTPELVYPSLASGSLKQFKMYEYFRPDLVSRRVSFSNGKFDYAINESESQQADSDKYASLSVTHRENGTQLNLTCQAKSIYSDWLIILGVVPCDEGIALNACENK